MRRASLADIRRRKDAGELNTNMPAADPESLDADFWKNAEVVERNAPTSVHLKLDPEVFAFFKSRGKGHLTRMQDVLRAYVRAHQK
ncbi:MAG: hypothetical protein EOP19_07925 [Hyphomicrobiales bacterium]|nr:MAG: hypothetical protein EOP19_07925 [Hyphomicrobiales bacterium]